MVFLKSCHFDTWKANHSEGHKDKMFRELYPFSVLRSIDFAASQIGRIQVILVGGVTYEVELQKNELQENGRWRSTFVLTSNIERSEHKWSERSWQERMQVVYSQDYHFITVFTKKEDAFKTYVKAFRNGRFNRITENRSRPLSSVLFRSLLLSLSEEMFGRGDYDCFRKASPTCPISVQGGKGFSPLYARGDTVWVCYSYQEDKAHRLASLFDVTPGGRVHVVFVNPVYTKHARCKKQGVIVQSLFEFSQSGDKDLFRSSYDQVRLLQNHLHEIPEYDFEALLAEIDSPKPGNYEIYKSELMEALAVMKVMPETKGGAFIYLSCMNLLNAYINRKRKTRGDTRLYRDMYSFKQYLLKFGEVLIDHRIEGVSLFVEPSLLLLEVDGFQFSFHHVPLSEALKSYMESPSNVEIPWGGKRLQPIAPLVLRYGRKRYSW